MQGIKHDLSKYSLEEFIPGVKYYAGDKSPITVEKLEKGYSMAWLHHKGRNRHHWEYYIDRQTKERNIICLPMPFNYVIECVLDKLAATKVYNNPVTPYEFFIKSYEINIMNENTSKQIAQLLLYLQENGEKKAFIYYKDLYKKWKKDHKYSI